uniref:Uncharacterized protein n=1 Tax=Oryza rufipogon TaxID=4529 RepID=A0A0E0NAF3_ORYRU
MEAKNQGKEEEEKQYRKVRVTYYGHESSSGTGRRRKIPAARSTRRSISQLGRRRREIPAARSAPPKGTSSREEEEVNAGRQEHSAATGTHREEEEANTGRQEHAAAATTGTNHNQNQDCIHRKEGGAPTSEGQEYQEEEIGEANRKDRQQQGHGMGSRGDGTRKWIGGTVTEEKGLPILLNLLPPTCLQLILAY